MKKTNREKAKNIWFLTHGLSFFTIILVIIFAVIFKSKEIFFLVPIIYFSASIIHGILSVYKKYYFIFWYKEYYSEGKKAVNRGVLEIITSVLVGIFTTYIIFQIIFIS